MRRQGLFRLLVIFFQSSEGQQYTAAAAAWAEGALRIATGAAATQPEIERNLRTYFAEPGDTPDTIAFKSNMREMYSRSIRRALGEQGVPGKLPNPTNFANKFVKDAKAGKNVWRNELWAHLQG